MASGEWGMASGMAFDFWKHLLGLERDHDILENKMYAMLVLSHKDLDVYKISFLLLNEVYKITNLLPREEKFGLSSQMRRAAVSVCSNIAEGASRFGKKEKKRFYTVARGSIVEIDTQIDISLQQKFVYMGQVMELNKHLESVFRILSKMISNLTL